MNKSILALALLGASTHAFAAWNVNVSVNEMSGEKTAYAKSDLVPSTKPMAFPYTGTEARMVVACNAKEEWVYTVFTKGPNISGSSKRTEQGYYVVKSRVRWDDQIKPVSLLQEWGGNGLEFFKEGEVIKDISSYKSALLELDWHGNNLVYFRFDLTGAAEAVRKIREECKAK